MKTKASDKYLKWGEPVALPTNDEPKPAERGAKHDAGKPRAGLMVSDFAHALQAVAAVTTFGANKYAPRSWATVPDARERYTDALFRHQLAQAAGEVTDSESGLPHASHIAWNALALLEMDTNTRFEILTTNKIENAR